ANTGNRAGTRPAPTNANVTDANADDKKIVGATLMVAPVQGANTGNRAGTRPAPTNANVMDANITNANVAVAPITLGDIIGAFKSITTNKYIEGVKIKIYPSFDRRLWQRNYFEHIIRNNESLNKIRTYIINNPENWDEDKFYSEINLLPPLSFNP
ncbi:MAG: transposase, partial [bacterium]|nr:transposase [bacterium]